MDAAPCAVRRYALYSKIPRIELVKPQRPSITFLGEIYPVLVCLVPLMNSEMSDNMEDQRVKVAQQYNPKALTISSASVNRV